jgi:hypothetical protein
VVGSGGIIVATNTVEVPLTSSSQIEIKVSSLNWIISDDPNNSDTKQLVSFDLQDKEESHSGFQLEPAEKYSYLTSENFDRLVSALSAEVTLKQAISKACVVIGAGAAVLNSSHLCTTLAYASSAKLTGLSVQDLYALNTKLTMTIAGVDLNCGFLFAIDAQGEKLEFSVKDDKITSFTSLEFRFPFTRSDRNMLGMNFLDNKLIFVDYYGLALTLSECTAGYTGCAVTVKAYYGVTQRTIKILVDILMFIMFVSLIFSSLIAYDKFMNDEEYAKE